MDEYSGYGLEHWRVYCPSVGYSIGCGKYFRFEPEAQAFVFRLRRAGHMAWYERA